MQFFLNSYINFVFSMRKNHPEYWYQFQKKNFLKYHLIKKNTSAMRKDKKNWNLTFVTKINKLGLEKKMWKRALTLEKKT